MTIEHRDAPGAVRRPPGSAAGPTDDRPVSPGGVIGAMANSRSAPDGASRGRHGMPDGSPGASAGGDGMPDGMSDGIPNGIPNGRHGTSGGTERRPPSTYVACDGTHAVPVGDIGVPDAAAGPPDGIVTAHGPYHAQADARHDQREPMDRRAVIAPEGGRTAPTDTGPGHGDGPIAAASLRGPARPPCTSEAPDRPPPDGEPDPAPPGFIRALTDAASGGRGARDCANRPPSERDRAAVQTAHRRSHRTLRTTSPETGQLVPSGASAAVRSRSAGVPDRRPDTGPDPFAGIGRRRGGPHECAASRACGPGPSAGIRRRGGGLCDRAASRDCGPDPSAGVRPRGGGPARSVPPDTVPDPFSGIRRRGRPHDSGPHDSGPHDSAPPPDRGLEPTGRVWRSDDRSKADAGPRSASIRGLTGLSGAAISGVPAGYTRPPSPPGGPPDPRAPVPCARTCPRPEYAPRLRSEVKPVVDPMLDPTRPIAWRMPPDAGAASEPLVVEPPGAGCGPPPEPEAHTDRTARARNTLPDPPAPMELRPGEVPARGGTGCNVAAADAADTEGIGPPERRARRPERARDARHRDDLRPISAAEVRRPLAQAARHPSEITDLGALSHLPAGRLVDPGSRPPRWGARRPGGRRRYPSGRPGSTRTRPRTGGPRSRGLRPRGIGPRPSARRGRRPVFHRPARHGARGGDPDAPAGA